jgi:hypothetical protein
MNAVDLKVRIHFIIKDKLQPLLAKYTGNTVCVIGIALSFIVFNGGIDVGYSNHVQLVPVARRILNPNYLPGDFNITLAYYHHRIFAYVIALFASVLGENRGLIILNVVGMICLSAGLYYVCQTLRIGRSGFLVAGVFIALHVGWAGLGLELNKFIGNPEIYPPTFAHAFMLFAVAGLLKGRYGLTAFLAGLVVFWHVQIGIIFAILLIPVLLYQDRPIRLKKAAYSAVLFLIPASLSLWQLFRMMKEGLKGTFNVNYIDFRMPHHMQLISGVAAAWVAAHLVLQVVAYENLRRTGRRESQMVGILLFMSLALAVLCVVHFVSYYWLRNPTVLEFQFLRLSPFMTVFGVLSFLVALQTWPPLRTIHGEPVSVSAVLIPALFLSPAILSARPLIREALLVKDTHSLVNLRIYDDEPSPWVDICHWIREHTPTNAVYITPPGNNGFTYLSNRSTVVEFKIAPDGGRYLEQWFDRLRDLAGGSLPNGRGFENELLLNEAFATISPTNLIAIAEKYHAEYAVLPVSSATGFEVLYQNGQYRLVRLSESVKSQQHFYSMQNRHPRLSDGLFGQP